jgi:hypothetical protein
MGTVDSAKKFPSLELAFGKTCLGRVLHFGDDILLKSV